MKKSNSKHLSIDDIKEIAKKKIAKIRKEKQFLHAHSQTLGMNKEEFRTMCEFDTIIHNIQNNE